MRLLQELGFSPEIDSAHQQKADPEKLTPDGYFKRAFRYLRILGEPVLEDLVPNLENYEGKVHPLGFMAFYLGTHPKLGSLRFHVYPANMDLAIPDGSGIHDHSWFLASLVLAGEYHEDRLRVEKLGILKDQDMPPEGALRVFKAYKSPGLPDTLTTDGSVVRAFWNGDKIVKTGSTHTLIPGEFHIPTIPKGRMAATLVLDSPSLGGEPSVLIRRSGEPFSNPHPRVTRYQIEEVKRQILKTI